MGCGAVAVACPGMGAKTALLVYAEADVGQALRDAVELDRVATKALVARLLPGGRSSPGDPARNVLGRTARGQPG